jgi:predicted alpha/beta hydrolase
MLDEQWEKEHLGTSEPSIVGQPLRLAAKDGYTLGATLTRASTDTPLGVLVVAGAMAVPHARYQKLARSFAKSGYHVLTFDYRGIGSSLSGSVRRVKAKLHEWGELDLAAVLTHAEARFPELPSFFLGHSVGGQLFGLAPAGRVRAAALFGSQSGYFGHWGGPSRAAMATLWHAIVPGLARTCGYLPMKAIGQGHDVPRDVALEWAKWGRDPKYILQWVESREKKEAFANYRGALRTYSFSDDAYAPRRAVLALARAYEGASKSHVHLEPRDIGTKRIGHFALLREDYEPTLWASARNFFAESLSD